MHGHTRRTTAALVLTGLLAIAPAGALDAGSAGKGVETHGAGYELALSPAMRTIALPRFDDRHGTRVLREIAVRIDGLIGASATIENEAPFTTIDDAGVSIWGDTVVLVTPGLPPAVLAHKAHAELPEGVALAPSDGIAGSGPDFHDFGFFACMQSTEVTSADAATLLAVTGTGVIDVEVEACAAIDEAFNTGAPHTFSLTECVAEGAVQITYRFDVVTVPCPGDLDGSGTVAFADLEALLGAWGACADPSACPEDLTGSGTVGYEDLAALLGRWGPCP